MSIFEKAKWLHKRGFYIGPRDPARNTEFEGEWMVCEEVLSGPSEDSSTGGYCVVGDDLNELISSAYNWER